MIADRVKGTKKKIIVPAYLLSTFAFAATAFSTDQSHFLISWPVQGCFNALAQPSIGAFTAEITPSRIRGQALSMQRTSLKSHRFVWSDLVGSSGRCDELSKRDTRNVDINGCFEWCVRMASTIRLGQ